MACCHVSEMWWLRWFIPVVVTLNSSENTRRTDERALESAWREGVAVRIAVTWQRFGHRIACDFTLVGWNVTDVGLPFLESVPDMCNSCQKRLTWNRPHMRRARLFDLPGLEAASAAMSEIWILSSCAELSNSVPEWYPTHQYFPHHFQALPRYTQS